VREYKAELIALLKDSTADHETAALDTDRVERDRVRRRGYDNDKTAPSHQEYLLRERQRAVEIDRLAKADGWIPDASPVEALAHDLIKLCTTHGLRLHATPDGIFIEVTSGDWREVMTAIEGAGYHHVV
jgi:hypothetical protein